MHTWILNTIVLRNDDVSSLLQLREHPLIVAIGNAALISDLNLGELMSHFLHVN
jgi:hypothetical protein